MSSASTCPCHLDWSTDIHGARREPVNNEKAWLIFAVRLLSRTVIGKVNGQETVWSQRFKPSWWDQEVGLAWKNPTTNPKDTKQVLMKKFEALQKHLKNEGKFPEVLEGEARLWNAGKFSDLFFMTSVLGVLEKTIDLHSAVTQLCARKGSRIFPDLALVGSIKKCLAATLLKLDQIGTSESVVLKTSNIAVNGRRFSKLNQPETSYNAVLETSDSGLFKTPDSSVNSRTFSKLNQLGTSDSGVLETSGSDVLVTSNSAGFKKSHSDVLETSGSDLLKTSSIAVNGSKLSKLNQLDTSNSGVLETCGSDVLVASNSAVFKTSGSGVLKTSHSAVNGRTFSKQGQLGTSYSTVQVASDSDVLETSYNTVKCRTHKRRSSISSGNFSNVSPHKSPKIDTPAVKNSQPTSGSVG